MSTADTKKVDIAILVPLEEEFVEFQATLGVDLQPVRDYDNGGYDYIFDFPASPTRSYRCVVRFIGDMGPDGAQTYATHLTARWQPAAAILIGIAASLDSDVKLGDVVVASQIDAYASNLKATPNPDGSHAYVLAHRGSVYSGDHGLLEQTKHVRFAYPAEYQRWQSAGLAGSGLDWDSPPIIALTDRNLLGSQPWHHRVHLASGPVVGSSQAYADWLHTRDGTLKALEMEAAGFMAAISRRLVHIPSLVLRGISDFGDERKKELDAIGRGSIRRYAMRNATRFLSLLLTSDGIAGHRSAESEANPVPS